MKMRRDEGEVMRGEGEVRSKARRDEGEARRGRGVLTPHLLCKQNQPKSMFYKETNPKVCDGGNRGSAGSPGSPPGPHTSTLTLNGWFFFSQATLEQTWHIFFQTA